MDKMKQWALLTLVAIVAVVAGGWFVLVSPQRSHASQLRSQTNTQQQQNQTLRSEIASLQSQHKGLPQVQAELAKLGVQLPSNPGLPALIRSLRVLPTRPASTSCRCARPTGGNRHSGSGTGCAASPAAATSWQSSARQRPPAAAGGDRSRLPARCPRSPSALIVNGGYFQVEQFVSNLEALSRPFLTTGITMAPQDPITATSNASGHLDTSTAAGAQSTRATCRQRSPARSSWSLARPRPRQPPPSRRRHVRVDLPARPSGRRHGRARRRGGR